MKSSSTTSAWPSWCAPAASYPGRRLFQYRDDDGQLQPVGSGEVNAYLREAMGAEFTAKDFRTWGGTLEALQRLGRLPLPERRSERALAQLQKQVLAEVAATLRNTPAVCRKAYIDPCVFAAWREGTLRVPESVRGPRQWSSSRCASWLAPTRPAANRCAHARRAGPSRAAPARKSLNRNK